MNKLAKRRTRTYPLGKASRVEVVTTDLEVHFIPKNEDDPTPPKFSIKATQSTGNAFTGNELLPSSDFVDDVIADKVFEAFAESDKQSKRASKPRSLPESDESIIDHRTAYVKKNKGEARGWIFAAAGDFQVSDSTISRRWAKIKKKHPTAL